MKKKRKIKPIVIGEDYIKIQRKLNRELELERNGGRWISINRVHKSKKAYDRKRDKKVKIDDSCLFFFALYYYCYCQPIGVYYLMINRHLNYLYIHKNNI